MYQSYSTITDIITQRILQYRHQQLTYCLLSTLHTAAMEAASLVLRPSHSIVCCLQYVSLQDSEVSKYTQRQKFVVSSMLTYRCWGEL